jgi:hypothetical protein
LAFGGHDVPTAATFFSATVFDLSGAINVPLFLIVRPRLLLFPRPEELGGPEMELAPQGDDAKHSPEPSTAEEGFKHGAAVSRIGSGKSDDI